jgi:hypothetical protein
MAHATAKASGGRPQRHEISPRDLLERWVEYARKTRRLEGPAATSRGGFAKTLDKKEATLRHYLEDYNFPWPPKELGQLVCLLDDAPPHEVLWVSSAWAALVGQTQEQLLYKPARYLRAIGFADGPRDEHLSLIRRLRNGPDHVGMTVGWIKDAADGQCQHVDYEFRYSSYAECIYIRATPVGIAPDQHVDIFNVQPGIIIRPRSADMVELTDREKLIAEWMAERERVTREHTLRLVDKLRETEPPYRGELQQTDALREYLQHVTDARRAD